jgi:hypothetical protein
VFDEEAGVFDDEEASSAGFFGGDGVSDAQLKPQSFGFDGDGGIGYGRNVFGAAEDVDDIDGMGDDFQAGIGFFAEDFGFVGVDGNDAVAGGLEVGGDFVGRTAGIGGEADDGDGFGGAEEIGDGVGGWKSVVWEMKVHEFLMKRTEKRIEEIGGVEEFKSKRKKRKKREEFTTEVAEVHRGSGEIGEGWKEVHHRGHRKRREEMLWS